MLARDASAAASGTGNNAADELFDLPTGTDTAAVTADDIDGGGDGNGGYVDDDGDRL